MAATEAPLTSERQGSFLRAVWVASFVDALGTGAFVSAAILFFTQHSGVAPSTVAVGLTLSAVAGTFASIPVAALADAKGTYSIFLALSVLRAVGTLGWVLVSGAHEFLAYCVIFGLVDRSAAAVTRALIIGPLAPEKAISALGMIALPTNLGYGLGAGIAALVAAGGWPLSVVLLINCASFLGAAAVYSPFRDVVPKHGTSRKRPALLAPDLLSHVFASPARRRVVLANTLMSFHRTVLSVGIPVWLVVGGRAPHWLIPATFLINCGVVALAQQRINETVEQTGAVRSAWLACGAALVLSLFLLALRPTTTFAIVLVLAGVLLSQLIAEMLHTAGMSVVMVRGSRQNNRALDLSAYNLGGQIQNIAGAAVFGLILAPGARWALIAFASFIAVQTCAIWRANSLEKALDA